MVFGYRTLALFLLSVFMVACNKSQRHVDVSDIDVEIKIQRFDEAVYHADIDRIDSVILELNQEYGRFYDLFNQKIINIGDINNRNYPDYFIDFITDYTVNEIMIAVHEKFANIEDTEQKLTQAFKHYKYYFPEKNIPEVLSFVAGFNQSVVIDEGILGIGLDKYLGVDSDIYRYIGVPMYKRKNMHPSKIPSDCMRALAMTEFPYNDSADHLMNRMIYEGKIMHFVDAMLPDEPDHLKIGFTGEQLAWCTINERKIWLFFIEEKLLYSSSYMQKKRYIDDSPFTVTFSQESPGRTGVWLGWQIVREYIKNNNVTLHQLMLDNDHQAILNHSKYKP